MIGRLVVCFSLSGQGALSKDTEWPEGIRVVISGRQQSRSVREGSINSILWQLVDTILSAVRH